jgi:hypothetical protein
MKKFYEFIEEMARNIGEPFSPLDKSEDQRKNMYSTNSNFGHHSYPISDNKSIELAKSVDVNKNTTYSTKDNIDEHLDSSFGKEERKYGKIISPDYETRHIILSKHKL